MCTVLHYHPILATYGVSQQTVAEGDTAGQFTWIDILNTRRGILCFPKASVEGLAMYILSQWVFYFNRLVHSPCDTAGLCLVCVSVHTILLCSQVALNKEFNHCSVQKRVIHSHFVTVETWMTRMRRICIIRPTIHVAVTPHVLMCAIRPSSQLSVRPSSLLVMNYILLYSCQ
jgi:hypothetical protein